MSFQLKPGLNEARVSRMSAKSYRYLICALGKRFSLVNDALMLHGDALSCKTSFMSDCVGSEPKFLHQRARNVIISLGCRQFDEILSWNCGTQFGSSFSKSKKGCWTCQKSVECNLRVMHEAHIKFFLCLFVSSLFSSIGKWRLLGRPTQKFRSLLVTFQFAWRKIVLITLEISYRMDICMFLGQVFAHDVFVIMVRHFGAKLHIAIPPTYVSNKKKKQINNPWHFQFCKKFRIGERCCEFDCLDSPEEIALEKERLRKRRRFLGIVYQSGECSELRPTKSTVINCILLITATNQLTQLFHP